MQLEINYIFFSTKKTFHILCTVMNIFVPPQKKSSCLVCPNKLSSPLSCCFVLLFLNQCTLFLKKIKEQNSMNIHPSTLLNVLLSWHFVYANETRSCSTFLSIYLFSQAGLLKSVSICPSLFPPHHLRGKGRTQT